MAEQKIAPKGKKPTKYEDSGDLDADFENEAPTRVVTTNSKGELVVESVKGGKRG